jgi:tRNA modification GTPase
MQLVLVGAPNVGKSALLNRLAGDELAIVTPVAGTTRDRIKATISLAGLPVHLIDTAGLRATQDIVEQAGIERTWEAIQQADAILYVRDGSEQSAAAVQADTELQNRIAAAAPAGCPILVVINKADLRPAAENQASNLAGALRISAKTGYGIEALSTRILESVGWSGSNEGLLIARQRHVDCIRLAASHLEHAKSHGSNGNQTLELFAEELRLAQEQLEAISGRTLPDDLLGKIFSQFCIGK